MSMSTELAAGFARLVQACNALAGRSLPAGGTAGQVLTKTAAMDYASAWQTPAGGGGNVFIQQTDPLVASPYIWYRTDASGRVIDILKG
jgi:hypothetical protein